MKLDVSLRDAHVYGGLTLAGIGGVAVSWPWTCVVIGSVVTVLGVFAPRWRKSG